jgi:hypothetical protein
MLTRTIRRDPLNPLHASSLRLRDREGAVQNYGTSGAADTFTRPIMFASAPNQICRLALSNTMCRIVFASGDGMIAMMIFTLGTPSHLPSIDSPKSVKSAPMRHPEG